MHEREAILPRHACNQRIDDQIIVKEMVARKGEEHAAKGTNEVREGVKIQDGADETETVAVEKVILDTPVPNAPNGENGEPRGGDRHLPIGPRHIVEAEAQGKKRATKTTSKGNKQTRA